MRKKFLVFGGNGFIGKTATIPRIKKLTFFDVISRHSTSFDVERRIRHRSTSFGVIRRRIFFFFNVKKLN